MVIEIIRAIIGLGLSTLFILWILDNVKKESIKTFALLVYCLLFIVIVTHLVIRLFFTFL
ncbi:hypothetical protein EV207_12552 [Scopulibacillus darangshiensis]|uniref:Stage III sporulation protein AC n=1 Tax=Scopulibacillus darangshiensis TaxID=442528 RepID=A0A4R2NSG8_9BACL|nr:hypothetical protein EV207_12552 [Scopulibacillus darangshiensis]